MKFVLIFYTFLGSGWQARAGQSLYARKLLGFTAGVFHFMVGFLCFYQL
jgi:hypothetical protein